MVRVAGLWDKWEDGINQRDASGLTVKEQLMKSALLRMNRSSSSINICCRFLKSWKVMVSGSAV